MKIQITHAPDLYSNFNHKLNQDAVLYLKNNPSEELCHVAYNFCSYVKFENNKFVARVMRYHSVVEIIENESIEKVIQETNQKYGMD